MVPLYNNARTRRIDLWSQQLLSWAKDRFPKIQRSNQKARISGHTWYIRTHGRRYPFPPLRIKTPPLHEVVEERLIHITVQRCWWRFHDGSLWPLPAWFKCWRCLLLQHYSNLSQWEAENEWWSSVSERSYRPTEWMWTVFRLVFGSLGMHKYAFNISYSLSSITGFCESAASILSKAWAQTDQSSTTG